ncbi:MAG: hypothetical protein NUW37_03535 [Planctomycetes bacterium]|nr:hypothetical protein [Planctomycetota bacterium]
MNSSRTNTAFVLTLTLLLSVAFTISYSPQSVGDTIQSGKTLSSFSADGTRDGDGVVALQKGTRHSKSGEIDVSGIWVVESEIGEFGCDDINAHAGLLFPFGFSEAFLMTQNGGVLTGAPQPDDGTNTGSGTIVGDDVTYELHTIFGSDNADSSFEGTVALTGCVCFPENEDEVTRIEGTYSGSGNHHYIFVFPNGESESRTDHCTWTGNFTAYRLLTPGAGSLVITTSRGTLSSPGTLRVCPCDEFLATQSYPVPNEFPDEVRGALYDALTIETGGLEPLYEQPLTRYDYRSEIFSIRQEFAVTSPAGETAYIGTKFIPGQSPSQRIDIEIPVPNALRIVKERGAGEESANSYVVDVGDRLEFPRDEFVRVAAFPTWTGDDGILNPIDTGDDVDCIHFANFGEGGFSVELTDSRPRDIASIEPEFVSIEDEYFQVAKITGDRTGHGHLSFVSSPDCPGVPTLQDVILIFVGPPKNPPISKTVTAEATLTGPTLKCDNETRWRYRVVFTDNGNSAVSVVRFDYKVSLIVEGGFPQTFFVSLGDQGITGVGQDVVTDGISFSNSRTYPDNIIEFDIVLISNGSPLFRDSNHTVEITVSVTEAQIRSPRVGGPIESVNVDSKIWKTWYRQECKFNLCFIILTNENGGLNPSSQLAQVLLTTGPGGGVVPNAANINLITSRLNQIWGVHCINFSISMRLVALRPEHAREVFTHVDTDGDGIPDDYQVVTDVWDEQRGPGGFLFDNTPVSNTLMNPGTFDAEGIQPGQRGDPYPNFSLPSLLSSNGTPGCIPVYVVHNIVAQTIDRNGVTNIHDAAGYGLTGWDIPDETLQGTGAGNVTVDDLTVPEKPVRKQTGMFLDEQAWDPRPGNEDFLSRAIAHEFGHILLGPSHRANTLMTAEAGIVYNFPPAHQNANLNGTPVTSIPNSQLDNKDTVPFLDAIGCN